MDKKYVYLFGPNKSDGDASMKELLGGKGANLAEMARIGIPVPPGFTISTEICTIYNEKGKEEVKKILEKTIKNSVEFVEKTVGIVITSYSIHYTKLYDG